MAAIWHQTGQKWELLNPIGFPDEATLHGLVEDAPMLLPLSGKPRLAIVGREVLLAGNYADLIAVETSGRPVVIEVKLAQNAEARRAVIAQVLTYAAYLHRLTVEQLESDVLGRHLRQRGFMSLADAVRGADQSGALFDDEFREALRQHLAAGSFRLILVVDSAPQELVRLVGYLESVTDKLVIDLVTVGSFDVNGSGILVPQRVEPERLESEPAPPSGRANGDLIEGTAEFIRSIESAEPADQPILRDLANWAEELEKAKLVRLFSYRGKRGAVTLLPRLQPENVGLVTIWNDGGRAYLSVWRSVFERRAPASIEAVERAISPTSLGKGNTIREITPELLAALSSAYAEAVAR